MLPLKMLFRSYYFRLSAVFLLLLSAAGASYIAIAAASSRRLIAETEQRLGRPYAGNIAAELRPLVADGLSLDEIRERIHYMMTLNPRVEIYLLDSQGTILAFFADPPAEIPLSTVDLMPVYRFLSKEDGGVVYGTDPRNPDRLKPFSAAPLRIGSQSGFVYIILGGERYDSALQMSGDDSILRTTLLGLLPALFVTGLVGLLLFNLLTRRIRRLEQAVLAFEKGNLDRRAPDGGSDEIGRLGRSFNRMAGTLETNILRLESVDRQRRELVAQISHDFRSPLTSIRGYLETLLMKGATLTPEQKARFLDVAWKNTLGLQELVEQFFELARLDTRQVKPHPEQLHPAELVHEVALKLQPRADEGGVSLEVVSSGDLSFIQADSLMIERVLTNLIDNALRHTPSGGSVRIVVEEGKTAVLFSVRDTGSGIAPEDLPGIFDPFATGTGNGHRPKGGTGLGLAIASRLVELHGGRLEVESRLQQGTLFRFTLPHHYTDA